jgi:hypothetical protein
MKQIFTLLTALVLANISFAQYSQNFDGTITSGCTVLVAAGQTTTAGEVISGTGSLYSNPPVSGSSTRDFSTPYLNIISTSLTVSFNYKLNSNLVGQAERTIQVGLEDSNGFTLLYTILMDKDNDPETATPFNQTFTVATGVKRLALKMGGSQGNGAVRIIIDDLNVSASSYYAGGCNTAPGLQDDTYNALVNGIYNGSSVLANDADINGETVGTPSVVTPSPDGSVVFNADGSFTFTPNVGFSGSSTSFTYQASDNGYDPASATATVTINFPALIPLPIQLISFSGSVVNNKVQLKWFVAENETGEHFEVEKSSDGKTFTSIALLFLTGKSGTENYGFNEGMELTGAGYYRLKITNRNGSVAYSKVVVLKNEKEGSTVNPLIVLQNKGAEITFNYTTPKEGIYNVNVYNVNGARMFGTRLTMQKGMNAASLKANGLISSGVYLLEVTNGADRSIIKFVK